MADFSFTQTGQQIQNDLDLVENCIAPEFDSTQTYAIGDIVRYKPTNDTERLWKCTTAVSTAGAWTGSTNWTETNVSTKAYVDSLIITTINGSY